MAASGAAVQYDVRSSPTQIVTDTDFNNAAVLATPPCSAPGSTEQLITVASGTRYIRLKTKDDNNGKSTMSNQVLIYQYQSGTCVGEGGMFAGGGGGGGASMQRAPGATGAQQSGTVPMVENSLLNGASVGTTTRDHYRIPFATTGAQRLTVRLRESSGQAAALDRARLLVVDHPEDLRPFCIGENMVLGTRRPAVRVTASDGTDLTAVVDGSASFAGAPGDTLTVDLGPGGGASPLVLEVSGGGAGIEIQAPDGGGGWRTASRCYPRIAYDELTAPPVGSDDLRLVLRGACNVRFVGRLAVSDQSPATQWATLEGAGSVRLGDVAAAVASADSVSTTLVGPDTLSLSYSAAPLAGGLVRDWFLAVEATPLDPRTLSPLQRAGREEAVPSRFALRQNQPNPFSARTSIRFELPVGTMVRLEIFDLLGRRVAVVANHYYPPGFHAVGWEPHADGSAVGPGVYFYRIEAGPFRDRKKMMLLDW